MKLNFTLLIIIFFSLSIYSQDSLSVKEIHSEKGLTYRNDNNELFNGIAQKFKDKNHLVFTVEFKKGILFKSITFYNGKKRIISDEIFYNEKGNKQKKIKYEYSSDYKWIEYYNGKNEKILEEEYKNGNLVYKCEFLNNKKNGIAISINEKGEKTECRFENGKYIK